MQGETPDRAMSSGFPPSHSASVVDTGVKPFQGLDGIVDSIGEEDHDACSSASGLSSASSAVTSTVSWFVDQDILHASEVAAIKELLKLVPAISDQCKRTLLYEWLVRNNAGYENWQLCLPECYLDLTAEEYDRDLWSLLRFLRSTNHIGEHAEGEQAFLESIAEHMSTESLMPVTAEQLRSRSSGCHVLATCHVARSFPDLARTLKAIKQEAELWLFRRDRILRKLKEGNRPNDRSPEQLYHLALMAQDEEAVELILEKWSTLDRNYRDRMRTDWAEHGWTAREWFEDKLKMHEVRWMFIGCMIIVNIGVVALISILVGVPVPS